MKLQIHRLNHGTMVLWYYGTMVLQSWVTNQLNKFNGSGELKKILIEFNLNLFFFLFFCLEHEECIDYRVL